jgi:hypothetical protein
VREVIKAFIDRLGYLYCPKCAALLSKDSAENAVWSGGSACDGDPCDVCLTPVPEHKEAVFLAFERGEKLDLSTDALAEFRCWQVAKGAQ